MGDKNFNFHRSEKKQFIVGSKYIFPPQLGCGVDKHLELSFFFWSKIEKGAAAKATKNFSLCFFFFVYFRRTTKKNTEVPDLDSDCGEVLSCFISLLRLSRSFFFVVGFLF